MASGGRHQVLDLVTVAIRNVRSDTTVGTGVIASADGRIVTCDHVVAAALRGATEAAETRVGIYFPQMPDDVEKLRHAVVVGRLRGYDDDLVVLQLQDSPLPPQARVAIMGRAADSVDRQELSRFKSFGFRRLQKYQGLPAEGQIIGFALAPSELRLLGRPLVLESQHVDSGMSGAPVLDVMRNLVIGVIAQTWDSGGRSSDRDTAFAVDAAVAAAAELAIVLRPDDLPFEVVPEPQIPIGPLPALRDVELSGAPPAQAHWIGRASLIDALTADWRDSTHRATGLVALGGEGKTSLARRWVDALLANPTLTQPEVVIWWNFAERPSVDEFLETAISSWSGNTIDGTKVSSPIARAHVLAAIAGSKRALLVLDGLETMQEPAGDRIGHLTSEALREFLVLACGDVKSFCVLISRLSLRDLGSMRAYVERFVPPLTADEGRALLRSHGATERDEVLDRVVARMGGHALALSLLPDSFGHRVQLGTDGIAMARAITQMLDHYDARLQDAPRVVLMIVSAFRTPVTDATVTPLMTTLRKGISTEAPSAFGTLEALRLVQQNRETSEYHMHPLVRAHYANRLLRDHPDEARRLHELIAENYLVSAVHPTEHPTLTDLAPYIEAVHHACVAQRYDEAFDLKHSLIDDGRRARLLRMGAFETELDLAREFFHDQDFSKRPLVSTARNQSYLLHRVALCMEAGLGRPRDAVAFEYRSIAINRKRADWENTATDLTTLAALHVYLGELEEASVAAKDAIEVDRRTGIGLAERNAHLMLSYVAYYRGALDEAFAELEIAEALRRTIPSDKWFGDPGDWMINVSEILCLRRAGRPFEARAIVRACLAKGATRSGAVLSVLGQLDADVGDQDSAKTNLEDAVVAARRTGSRSQLIVALIRHGQWAARHGYLRAARASLDESLGRALDGEYVIFEVDARVARAWLQYAAGDLASGAHEAETAHRVATDIGFHWGASDANAVMTALADELSRPPEE